MSQWPDVCWERRGCAEAVLSTPPWRPACCRRCACSHVHAHAYVPCVRHQVMDRAIELHNVAMRRLVDEMGGHEIRNEGDSFTLSFHDAVDAVMFCIKVRGAHNPSAACAACGPCPRIAARRAAAGRPPGMFGRGGRGAGAPCSAPMFHRPRLASSALPLQPGSKRPPVVPRCLPARLPDCPPARP